MYKSEALVIASADTPLHYQTVQVIMHCEIAQAIAEPEEDQLLLDKLCLPELDDIQTLSPRIWNLCPTSIVDTQPKSKQSACVPDTESITDQKPEEDNLNQSDINVSIDHIPEDIFLHTWPIMHLCKSVS